MNATLNTFLVFCPKALYSGTTSATLTGVTSYAITATANRALSYFHHGLSISPTKMACFSAACLSAVGFFITADIYLKPNYSNQATSNTIHTKPLQIFKALTICGIFFQFRNPQAPFLKSNVPFFLGATVVSLLAGWISGNILEIIQDLPTSSLNSLLQISGFSKIDKTLSAYPKLIIQMVKSVLIHSPKILLATCITYAAAHFRKMPVNPTALASFIALASTIHYLTRPLFDWLQNTPTQHFKNLSNNLIWTTTLTILSSRQICFLQSVPLAKPLTSAFALIAVLEWMQRKAL